MTSVEFISQRQKQDERDAVAMLAYAYTVSFFSLMVIAVAWRMA